MVEVMNEDKAIILSKRVAAIELLLCCCVDERVGNADESRECYVARRKGEKDLTFYRILSPPSDSSFVVPIGQITHLNSIDSHPGVLLRGELGRRIAFTLGCRRFSSCCQLVDESQLPSHFQPTENFQMSFK